MRPIVVIVVFMYSNNLLKMTSTLGGGALAQSVNTITDCMANRKAHQKKIDGEFNIIKQAFSFQNIKNIKSE